MYEVGDPAWERLFFLPAVRGDPSEQEKERFTGATEALARCLQARARVANLRLHSFGRDGSTGYAFPRRHLTKPSLADVVGGVFHVNIVIRIRERLESKLELQEANSIARFRKRSREGRNLSREDLSQQYFFAVKWASLDRFYYSRDLVKFEMAEAGPTEGLRAGVNVDSFLDVAAELLAMWAYPLTDTMPEGLQNIFDDYVAALDEGLWCLLHP